MSLRVARLETRLRGPVAPPPARVRAWTEAIAAADGDRIAGALAPGEGWVFVRRLSVATHWRVDEADVEVGARWQQALAQALQQTLQELPGVPVGDEVLRYRHRHDAVADLLYRSALGDDRRQWAWVRLGLLPASAAPCSCAEALQAGTLLLLREPEAVWPVLARLMAAEAACAALSAVLRAVPAAVWQGWLRLSPRTAAYAEAASTTREDPTSVPSELDAVAPERAAPWLAWLRARPVLRATQGETMAALIAAATWPEPTPVARVAARRLQALQFWWSRSSPRRERAALEATAQSNEPPSAAAQEAATPAALPAMTLTPARARPPEAEPLPALPATDATWRPTAWGGVLFFLRLLPQQGWLDLDEGARPLVLRQLALSRALGVPDADPACAAMCGGERPSDEPEAVDVERAAALATRWADGLDAAAPDLPAPRLAAVCARQGRLRLEPGWITLRLPLASVNTAVRRLGLDLDPGWLPWLGCVVRFDYED